MAFKNAGMKVFGAKLFGHGKYVGFWFGSLVHLDLTFQQNIVKKYAEPIVGGVGETFCDWASGHENEKDWDSAEHDMWII